jgi:hypothetical protein
VNAVTGRLPIPLVALAALLSVSACALEPSSRTSASPSAIGVESPGVTACTQTSRSPGTYVADATDTMTVPVTITFTEAGWNGCGLWVKEFGSAGTALIAFWAVDNVYANPCQWKGALMDPPAGPRATDLVNAMVDQELTDASAPSASSLGGYPAGHVLIEVPTDLDVSACDTAVEDPEFRFWKGPGEELTGSAVWWVGAEDAPGLIGEVWSMDLDTTRLAFQAAYFSDAAPAEVEEIHAIVDSIALMP